MCELLLGLFSTQSIKQEYETEEYLFLTWHFICSVSNFFGYSWITWVNWIIIPKLITIGLGLDPRSINLSFFSEALIYNSQRNGRGHYNKGIGFARGNIVSFIL